eukprot:4620644-Prymnesium_polylepis.1
MRRWDPPGGSCTSSAIPARRTPVTWTMKRHKCRWTDKNGRRHTCEGSAARWSGVLGASAPPSSWPASVSSGPGSAGVSFGSSAMMMLGVRAGLGVLDFWSVRSGLAVTCRSLSTSSRGHSVTASCHGPCRTRSPCTHTD